MTVEEKAKSWLESSQLDDDARRSIEALRNDKTAFIDAFYKDLEFGTGGLRGIMGVGTNRINFIGDFKLVIFESRHDGS